jgi:integrase
MPPLCVPKLCRHKASHQGVVRLNGRDFYLGVYGSPECEQRYRQLLAEWLADDGHLSRGESDLTINEVVLSFVQWADEYYRKPDGSPTKEPEDLRLAMRPLVKLYGSTLAREFGPLALRAVRDEMIWRGNCRTLINRRVSKIRRLFKWAAGRELLSAAVHQALTAVEELRRGRSQAKESHPVLPVPIEVVEATLPYLSRQVAAMVRLQLLTGGRPGEICAMRACDLDMTGAVWIYMPPDHKTAWRGRQRRIYLGPEAQRLLRDWLRPDREVPLFQPREADAERRAAQRVARKTKVQPSQVCRKKRRPSKRPGDRYITATYRGAIQYGVAKANRARAMAGLPVIPTWHPNQLRHLAASRLQKQFGWDIARAVLGHESPATTAIYVERDERLALEAASRAG